MGAIDTKFRSVGHKCELVLAITSQNKVGGAYVKIFVKVETFSIETESRKVRLLCNVFVVLFLYLDGHLFARLLSLRADDTSFVHQCARLDHTSKANSQFIHSRHLKHCYSV